MFTDGGNVSLACTEAGSIFVGTTMTVPCLTSLSGFDDRMEVDLVLLLPASDMAGNDSLMSSSVGVVGLMLLSRRAVINRSEELSSC